MTTFPDDLLTRVMPALQQRLMAFTVLDGVPRCLLAFVVDDRLILPPKLKLGEANWEIHHTGTDVGLIGKALRTGNVETSNGEDKDFYRGERRTVYEIAASVDYKDGPAAVLLIDHFEGDKHVPAFKVERWRSELSAILASAEDHAAVEADILAITKTTVEATSSERGFTAIVMWDGTVRYCPYGDNEGKFKYLSQLEGVCGEVLSSGIFQNLDDVSQSRSYFSSDEGILSEVVVPIRVGNEVVGVLNMESERLNHYDSEAEAAMRLAAEDLSDLARQYRTPPGSGISTHSRLLSDLVEKFSIGNSALSDELDPGKIREWAHGLCLTKVRSLDGVQSAEVLDPGAAFEEEERPIGKVRRAMDSPLPVVNPQADGTWSGKFDILLEAVVVGRLEVIFAEKPSMATCEIVSQFWRLTGNEIRRRTAEISLVEMVRLIESIRTENAEGVLLRLPEQLRRMLDCDEVTYMRAHKLRDGQLALKIWQTTSMELRYRFAEDFYRVSVDDGVTGFAATQRDVFTIRNLSDQDELQRIDPRLKWKRKIAEGAELSARSYFVVPLYRANGLVGAIRGYRGVIGNTFPFSAEDEERLRLVQLLLEKILEAEGVGLGPPLDGAPVTSLDQ